MPFGHKDALPRLTLVLGGARSGKSGYAEELIRSRGAETLYIATAEPNDDEMRRRIAQHRARRGAGWSTIEAPLELPQALRLASRPALVDCLTLWLSNLFFHEHDVEAACEALGAALRGLDVPVVLVTNELGLGLVPETAVGRAFRDRAGLLNQEVATLADRVVFVAAGLPLLLKGGN